MHAAVDPMRTLPAPASENVGRSGVTGPEHTIACDTVSRSKTGGATAFVTRISALGEGLQPRQRELVAHTAREVADRARELRDTLDRGLAHDDPRTAARRGLEDELHPERAERPEVREQLEPRGRIDG